MHATEGMGNRVRGHRPIRRIVIALVLAVALLEPFFMYRSLVRQRAERQTRADAALSLPASAVTAGSP